MREKTAVTLVVLAVLFVVFLWGGAFLGYRKICSNYAKAIQKP